MTRSFHLWFIGADASHKNTQTLTYNHFGAFSPFCSPHEGSIIIQGDQRGFISSLLKTIPSFEFPFLLLMPCFPTVRQQFTLLMQVACDSGLYELIHDTSVSRSLGPRPCKGTHTNLHERHSHQLCTLKGHAWIASPEKVKSVLCTLE